MDEPKRGNNAVVLQDRDLVLLRGLFESRVMTTDHAKFLYFDGNYETAKQRLRKLKLAGILTERPRRPTAPSVLFLTGKGLKILQDEGVLGEYPAFSLPALEKRAHVSDLTIRHELEVMDVITAFHSAVKKSHGASMGEYSTWPLLHEFVIDDPNGSGKEIPVRPDGFVRLRQEITDDGKYDHDLFLELDRSEEVQDKLMTKARCYREYYRTGGFAVRNRARREDVAKFPFRVLMVLQSAVRRNNTSERLLQIDEPILRMVWLTTLSEVTADPFGPIWVRPVDYRQACQGTRFEPERSLNSSMQRNRNREREQWIESKIAKRRLFDSELP